MRQLFFVLLGVAILVAALACGPSVRARPEFKMGFKELADQLPSLVGEPVENEHYGVDGDSLQQTTTGLMAWRKSDNWTAFTNGTRTWVNGPLGVQERGNEERFEWESPGPAAYPVRGKLLDLLEAGSRESYSSSSVRMSLMAKLLEEEMGTPVRLTARQGGAVAMELLSGAPDGYTLAYLAFPELISSYLFPSSISYSRQDFQPVAVESLEPLAVAVPRDSRFKNLQELMAAARLNPEKIRIRSESPLGRLAVDEMERLAGVELVMAQGEGADAEVQPASRLVAGVKAGRIRVLGVADSRESPALAGVKTLGSQGYDLQVLQPWGYVVRAGTPGNIVESLASALKGSVSSGEYARERQSRLASWGLRAAYHDPGQASALWADLEERMRRAGR